ncbi:MAG: ATP-binding protein [Saccharothrix sp.]|nr:ATP-binding protein [Saccharothrix sp.]
MTGTDDDPVLDLDTVRAPELGPVRRWVAGAIADLDPDQLSDVLLVANELVSNVHDHAPGAGRIRVARRHNPCQVVIEVDDSSTAPPIAGRSRLGVDRGRGVSLVAALSEAWGVRRLDQGKTVWAVVSCEGADRCAREAESVATG